MTAMETTAIERDHDAILDHRHPFSSLPERFDLLVQHDDLENDRIHFECPVRLLKVSCGAVAFISTRTGRGIIRNVNDLHAM